MDAAFEDFAQSIASCPTLTEIGDAFRSEIARHGFISSACRAFVPTTRGEDFKVLFRNWPKGWAQTADQRGSSARNFMIAEARQRMTPFTWLEAQQTRRMTAADHETMEGVTSYGLRNGFIQPVHGPGGYFALVSIATREREVDLHPRWRMSLQMLSLCAHERASSLAGIGKSVVTGETLTTRELECLRWVANGKADCDIADILSISATTVKFHVDGARRKLGARTRAQAIARLVLSGLY
ncbi:MAG: LuxR family transcriptional regulator [Alphaproteobacteria bacterium]